jgi:hypothetical protein
VFVNNPILKWDGKGNDISGIWRLKNSVFWLWQQISAVFWLQSGFIAENQVILK